MSWVAKNAASNETWIRKSKMVFDMGMDGVTLCFIFGTQMISFLQVQSTAIIV